MMKATFSKFLLNSKSSRISGVSNSDNSKIDKFCEYQQFDIFEANPLENHWRFGKEIIARVFDVEKNNTPEICICIGTLNSIKQLINEIENISYKKLIKLYIGKNEYGKNNIKSLKKIGINENFDCKVKYDKDNLSEWKYNIKKLFFNMKINYFLNIRIKVIILKEFRQKFFVTF